MKWLLKKRALAFANRVRALQGREPLTELPKGRKFVVTSCPIANAINGEYSVKVVANKAWWTNPVTLKREVAKIPFLAQAFIFLFDNGFIPSLDKDKR